MWRILSATILPIIAGYILPRVDPIGTFLAPYVTYEWQSQVLLSSVLLLCFLIPYRYHINKKYSIHVDEQKELFTSSIELIKARTRLTLGLISEFKLIFNKNKYFIRTAQEKMLIALISDLGDIRIDDEELKSNTLSPVERKSLVAHRRILIDRVENMLPTIEKYLRKIK